MFQLFDPKHVKTSQEIRTIMLAAAVDGQLPSTSLRPLGYVLVGAAGIALAAHRRAPVTTLVVTALCTLGYVAVGFDVGAVAYLVAVYATVRAGYRVVTVAASVIVLAAVPFAILAAPADSSMADALARSREILPLAWLIAAGAAGEALRQAERRADEAERTREATAQRRADEERLHIARELHDSLTHQISVIKVQAEVAVHLARKRGDPVPDALLAIRAAGREATRELRATLEALRDDSKAPPHGVDQIPELVERAGATGLDVTLAVEGHRSDVPAAVDRTAYRIVQESLTNIARHADTATAWVRIDYGPDALVIQIDDDGRAAPDATPTPGVGLLGMRERVTALGGRLHAAPRSEGGFTVRAELPVEQIS